MDRSTRGLAVCFVPLMLSLPATGQVNAADEAWTGFRGPNGSGVADAQRLPVFFGPDQNVVWKIDLPAGHSSPVLSHDSVFVTAEEDGALLTICLDRDSGEIRWRREAPRARQTKVDERNNAASPTPAVGENSVVVFFPDSGLVSYSLDGDERWRMPLGPFDNMYGMGASPLWIDGVVYLACDQNLGSYLIAVDDESGEELWRVDRPEARSGHCTPILFEPDDGPRQLVLPGSFLLSSYDLQTGDKVWWSRGLSFEMKSVPLLYQGAVYINGFGSPMNQPGNQVEVPAFEAVIRDADKDGNGQINQQEMPPSKASAWFDFVDLDASGELDSTEWGYLRAALGSLNGLVVVRAGGTGDVTESNSLWSYRRSVPQLPSLLIFSDILYMLTDSGGIVTTFEPSTGEVLQRGRIKDAIDEYYASPIAGDGKVYLTSLNGSVVVLPADGSLEPLAVNHLEERCYATPAISGDRLYLRTASRLYCFGEDESDFRKLKDG